MKKNARGFTLVELIVTVAVLSVLVTLAVTSVLSGSERLKVAQYNNNAEAVAVAAQQRMTSLFSSGRTKLLRSLGVSFEGGDVDGMGGKRCLFADDAVGSELIFPSGSLESDLASGNYAVVFDSETAVVERAYFFGVSFSGISDEARIKYLLDLGEDLSEINAVSVGFYSQPSEDIRA